MHVPTSCPLRSVPHQSGILCISRLKAIFTVKNIKIMIDKISRFYLEKAESEL